MNHHCHAVGCETRVPPKMFMCLAHWRRVPRELQRAVWANYRPGQEDDKRPTAEYMRVTDQARRAVAEKEGNLPQWEAEHIGYARTISLLEALAVPS